MSELDRFSWGVWGVFSSQLTVLTGMVLLTTVTLAGNTVSDGNVALP